jgi:hypothetical protein
MNESWSTCAAVQCELRRLRDTHPSTETQAHMEVCDRCMDLWLSLILAEKPDITAPEGFASSVVASLPQQPQHPNASYRYGSWAGMAALLAVGLLIGYKLSSPYSASRWSGLALELSLAVEIATIALWSGRTSRI